MPLNRPPSDELFLAAKTGDATRLCALLDAGADVMVQDPHGETALVIAATYGHLEVVEALLHAGASPDQGGRSLPLCAAATRGHLDVVLGLINAGAEVDARDEASNTPLMCAARGGELEIVEALLDAGAEPNLKDSMGKTARDHAAANEQTPVVDYFDSLTALDDPEEGA